MTFGRNPQIRNLRFDFTEIRNWKFSSGFGWLSARQCIEYALVSEISNNFYIHTGFHESESKTSSVDLKSPKLTAV